MWNCSVLFPLTYVWVHREAINFVYCFHPTSWPMTHKLIGTLIKTVKRLNAFLSPSTWVYTVPFLALVKQTATKTDIDWLSQCFKHALDVRKLAKFTKLQERSRHRQIECAIWFIMRPAIGGACKHQQLLSENLMPDGKNLKLVSKKVCHCQPPWQMIRVDPKI